MKTDTECESILTESKCILNKRSSVYFSQSFAIEAIRMAGVLRNSMQELQSLQANRTNRHLHYHSCYLRSRLPRNCGFEIILYLSLVSLDFVRFVMAIPIAGELTGNTLTSLRTSTKFQGQGRKQNIFWGMILKKSSVLATFYNTHVFLENLSKSKFQVSKCILPPFDVATGVERLL